MHLNARALQTNRQNSDVRFDFFGIIATSLEVSSCMEQGGKGAKNLQLACVRLVVIPLLSNRIRKATHSRGQKSHL